VRRLVKPERLDSLPHGHPDAVWNRRDIRLFNALMGNYRWLRRELARRLPAGGRVLEIGAGAGDFMRKMARADGAAAALTVDGLDLCPSPGDGAAQGRWWRRDVLDFDCWGKYDAVVANFLFHQFERPALARIGERLRSGPRVVLASELARRRRHLLQLRAARLLGINHVTRHDAAVSVEAGFLGRELPQWLGLDDDPAWSVSVRIGWLGQYWMTAERER